MLMGITFFENDISNHNQQLIKSGPLLELFWTKGKTNKKAEMYNGVDLRCFLKGAIMIVVGCFSWSCFMVLQGITLKSYPAELAMTAWICLLATVEGAIVALIMERTPHF
ncbi:hypothetical protein HanRHA438_Chr11g0525891 [Helianthus annuus]|uniref:WAT1-related protein n=1 Tax=Helianthus annuus TaxID=4232 RepID=A0A9K3N1W7_HELAN|nr:hypothetical protein HanXRQr2_Chr11g0513941 [Helianthus annuus]KAJ0872619.1 hypothetical protein HanRHA438_Chr11g0525891 [Helianthus annuus]